MATMFPISTPALEPPSSPLPAIPSSKPRKSLPMPRTAYAQTPIKLRLPSASPRPSALPTPASSASSPVVPTLRSTSIGKSASATPERTVRKTISIAAFPQPPNTGSRPTTASSITSISSLKPRSSDINGNLAPAQTLRRKPSSVRLSASTVNSFRGAQTPSLLNSSGDGKSVRTSAGQISLSSPTHSRSSSAQGSYSTSATTFEDTEDHNGEGQTTDQRQLRSKSNKGNVLVSVRVRPDAFGQETSRAEGEWMVDGRRSLVAYRGREGGDYFYDNVFATHDNNAKVYDASAKRLVRRVMEGYHGTVFAYGMTGTGKTFSMQGTATSPGVIPLAITDIFSYIRETPSREFLLRVSYLEIYNEKIHDLLSTTPPGSTGPGGIQQEEIKLREDSKRGVYASPLKEEIVQSPTQLLRVIARGDNARRTSSTQFNARSSRSHAVVQIVVESRQRVPTNPKEQHDGKRDAIAPGGVRVSTLSLIDLAGSERAAESKERRTEGAHINKSLLTLGTVIARLSGDKDKNGNQTDSDGKHLPYRDSKLTRLLQPALSGNSLVSILCTIQLGSQGTAATATSHTGETLNTLKFAARAKNNIVSHAKKAEEAVGTGVNAGLLERYRSEIQTLRTQLDGQQKAAFEKEEKQLEKEAEQRHEEQMLEMQLARTALKERIEHLNRLILCSKSTGVNSTSGNMSALGMHSRLAGDTVGENGSRSVRSSASQSTLGAAGPNSSRVPSMASLKNGRSSNISLLLNGEEEDGGGEYGDGVASVQAQNRALQADLQDKNRYISTLEKRLLQARRSSHSRTSAGFSHKGSIVTGEDAEMSALLQEKDSVIADLRARLDDKERMVSALRSAARKREMAELTPESSSVEFKKPGQGHQSNDSHSSSLMSGNSHAAAISPMEILSPRETSVEKKEKNMDEVSKILDAMIQDKVESGHLIKGRSGSVRIPSESRRTSSVPALGTMISSLRDRESVIDPQAHYLREEL